MLCEKERSDRSTDVSTFSSIAYLFSSVLMFFFQRERNRKKIMLKVLIVILLIGIGTSTASRVKINDVKLDLCPLCINEAVEAINVILNVILDEGILQSCGELCGIAANKSHSKFLGEVCEAACDAFGLDEFIHLIITADLDPIWYCEMADLCPSKLRNSSNSRTIFFF